MVGECIDSGPYQPYAKTIEKISENISFFPGGTWAYRHGEVGWDDS
jgi:hypothetical protein